MTKDIPKAIISNIREITKKEARKKKGKVGN